MTNEEKIELLKKWIGESNNIVFFGGAGVSTESGIPDFRSKDGLYNQHDVQFEQFTPEYLLSRDCLFNNPKVFYEFYKQKLDVRDCEPNITHKVLAKLEETGKLKAVVTQNIDGLHQKAGSKTVYEIHGTTERNYCHKCKKEFDKNYIFECKDSIPKCDCGGLIRPDVTLYGENLPCGEIAKTEDAISKADMLIVGGTSLTVWPAASYVHNFCGKHLVVINKDRVNVPMDDENDLYIKENLGTVFGEIDSWLNENSFEV